MSERILVEKVNLYKPNNGGNELVETDVLIEGSRVTEVGLNLKQKVEGHVVYLDGSGKIGVPGLINTHDHPSQTFMKDVPDMQNQRIDTWISEVSRLSRHMDPEAHYHAAKVKALELLLSGATTTSNMVYLFPQIYDHSEIADAVVAGVSEVGMRHVFFRGSMSRSQKDGALFPDDVVETSDQIVQRSVDIINRYHGESSDSMIKIGVAPCTILTSSSDDYVNAAMLATRYDICIQTHLSESSYEQDYVRENFAGMTPLQLLHSLGWSTSLASFAHCIEVTDRDINDMAIHRNSICHCPISNSRSPHGQNGIAPIAKMLKSCVNVSIGVDGSAGNNSGNMLEEMKWARTIAGARVDSTYLPVDHVFDMATVKGARALNWPAIGSIEPGKCADLTIFDIRDSVTHFGNWDPLSALISCQAIGAETVIVDGKIVVSGGHHVQLDETKVLEEAWRKWKKVFNK